MRTIDEAMLRRAYIYDLTFPPTDIVPFFDHEVRGLRGVRDLLALITAGGDPEDFEPGRAILPVVTGVPLHRQLGALQRLAAFALDVTAPALDTWMRESVEASALGPSPWHLSAGAIEAPPDTSYCWVRVLARCHHRNRLTLRGGMWNGYTGALTEPETLDTSADLPTDGVVCPLCREIAAGTRRPVWPKVAR